MLMIAPVFTGAATGNKQQVTAPWVDPTIIISRNQRYLLQLAQENFDDPKVKIFFSQILDRLQDKQQLNSTEIKIILEDLGLSWVIKSGPLYSWAYGYHMDWYPFPKDIFKVIGFYFGPGLIGSWKVRDGNSFAGLFPPKRYREPHTVNVIGFFGMFYVKWGVGHGDVTKYILGISPLIILEFD